jgi:hypothetical protein
MSIGPHWKPHEIETLKKGLRGHLSYNQIAELIPGWSAYAIRTKANQLKLVGVQRKAAAPTYRPDPTEADERKAHEKADDNHVKAVLRASVYGFAPNTVLLVRGAA